MTRPTSKGKPILDYITAEWYNKVSWMLDHYRQHVPKPQPFPETECLVNKAHNESGTDIPAYEACVVYQGVKFLGTGRILRPNMVVPKIQPKNHSTSNYQNWYVTERPIPAGRTGRIITQGLCWLKFTQIHPDHQYVWGYNAGTNEIVTSISGKARIIQQPTVDTSGYGVVYLGEYEAPSYEFKIDDIITAAVRDSTNITYGTGTGKVWKPTFSSEQSPFGGGGVSTQWNTTTPITMTIYNDQEVIITADQIIQTKNMYGRYFVDVSSC